MEPTTQPTVPLVPPTTPIAPVPTNVPPVQQPSTPIDFTQFLKTTTPNIPGKSDINPATGKAYAVNPDSGNWDDNYWSNTVEPGLKSAAGGGQPTFDLIGATNAAYNTPEILAANNAITAANTELTTRQQALADAQAEINDNPFYSEATRVGQSAKLSDKANADMLVIQNKIQQAQNQATTLRADAAIKINAAQGQYNINEQAYQDQLSEFNNLVSMGGLDDANGTDIANIAMRTGIPTSMIQSIQNLSKAKDNPVDKPQIVTSTDNAGNLSILAIDPSSGKLISQTVINSVGKAAKGSSGKSGSSSESESDQNISNLTQDIKNKVTLKSLIQHYGSALSVDKIFQLYAANSPWGAPKETLAQVKAGQYAD